MHGREERRAVLERDLRETMGKLLCLGKLKEKWRKKIISFSISHEYF